MSTHWEDGDILVSSGPNGLDCDVFDVADPDGHISVVIYFPKSEWEEAYLDESGDECLELINQYTFPNWLINDCSWDCAAPDADADPDQVAINADIWFDLTD